ncbi:MAG TPA: NAD(P)/FAD-dependent oxidoreductase [Pseudomonadales bacterium]|nr:NAD(P)/FAD-dependent oxidoreductase [Pseudomonadales bacterium]
MTPDVDAVVIGAGVVGLAVARALALGGAQVLVLEAADAAGTMTSARNSGVIHAGLYYPTGSLKARLCVDGRRALYRYAAERAIDHARPGKLIVATGEAELGALDAIHRQAGANGVEGVRRLSAADVRALEPEVRAVAGLLSTATGIVDPHDFMVALQGDLEAAGGMVVPRTPLLAAQAVAGGFRVDAGGAAPTSLTTRRLVNAAGLEAAAVAARIDGLPAASIPPAFYAVGHYYACSGTLPFSHLVYPVPEAGGLGIHFTLDLGGGGRFGPDVRWIDAVDHRFDDSRRDAFAAAIRRWWPGLDPARLMPAYTGIRPKIVGPGAPAADFALLGPRDHGVPGYVGLHGIESPGLTSALALGDAVAALLAREA